LTSEYYFAEGPHIVHTFPRDNDVRGVALLNNELYVLRDRDDDQVDIYSTTDFTLLSYLSVRGVSGRSMRDITACERKRCIYISDNGMSCVHRVRLDAGMSVNKWRLGGGSPRGLSLTRSSNLLVTCSDWRGKDCKLLELSSDSGDCVREIRLESCIDWLWHGIELDSGQYIVCCGTRAMNSRLCQVDSEGRVTERNSSDEGLSCPCHLAVDVDGSVFVANAGDKYVPQCDAALKFVGIIIKHKLHSPQRLCVDHVKRCLYVGQTDGNVIVVQL